MDVFGGAPRFLSYPRTFTVPNGADAILKCQIAGDPRPTVIWERDKTQIYPTGRFRFLEDGNIYNLIVAQARVEDSGQYICKAKNRVGETYAAATLKVEEGDVDPKDKPAFLVKPTSARVARGDNVVFTGQLAGCPVPTVTWEKDGQKLGEIFESGHFSEGCDGDGWHHLKIFNTRVPDAGVYLCKARNTFGEAMTAAVLLVEPGTHTHGTGPPADLAASHPSTNGIEDSQGPDGRCRIHEATRERRQRSRHRNLRDPQTASRRSHQNRISQDTPRVCKVKVFSVSEGKHAKFRCYVTGKPKPEIIWRKDGRLIAPGRRHLLYEDREGYFILKVLYCKQQDNGLYACAASNAAGQTLSSVLLNVKEPYIKFKSQLQDIEVNEREQAVLECEVPGDSTPAVWYLEDRKLHSSAKYIIEQQGSLRRLIIRDITMDDDGIYLCEMNDGGRSIAEVAVKGKIVKRLPRKLDVVEGENAAFCADLDEENVDVSWYKDGELLRESHKTIIKSFGKTHILVFVNATTEDSGIVTFVISDSKSSSQLRVKPRRQAPPSAPVNARMNSDKPNVASLLWGAPPDGRRSGVTAYVIERQEEGSEEWVRCLTAETSAAAVEILGDSIPAEARYRFRVCSVNNHGRSELVEFPGTVHLVPSARIHTHLNDMVVHQGADAEFTIELSTSVLATWHMKGQQLHDDERFKIQQSRSRHSLLIRGAKMEENGSEVTFVAHGVRDSAILFVKAAPVRITMSPGMERVQQVAASESIVLCCELSRSDVQVRWCKDGEVLAPSERLTIQPLGHIRKLIVQSARPSDSGQYACDAADDVVVFSVNVFESPVRIVNSADDTKMEYLLSECIVLTCELSRSNAEVTWYKDGLEIEGSDNVKMESHGVHRSLIVQKAGTEDSGEYVCDAGDDSIFYDITVKEPPVKIVNCSAPTMSVLTGGEVDLSCELSRPEAEVRWYKDGVEVERSTRTMMEVDGACRRLTIRLATMEDRGTYVCDTVEDTATFEVTVHEPPVKIVNCSAPTMSVLTGDEVVLSCEFSRPEAVVRWYKDGVQVKGSKRSMLEVDGVSRKLTIRSAAMEDRGTYVCDAVDDSAKFELTVSEPPVKIVNRSAATMSVLTGGEIVLSCELSRPEAELRWYKDGLEVERSTRSMMEVDGACRRLTIRSATMEDRGTYVCDTVEDTAMFEVTVSEPPVKIKRLADGPAEHKYLTSEDIALECELSRSDTAAKWYKDGEKLEGNERVSIGKEGTLRTLRILDARTTDSGEYLCDVQDDSVVFRVCVEEPPVKIKRLADGPAEHKYLTSEDIALECELSRSDTAAKWYKDGEKLEGNKRVSIGKEGTLRTLRILDARTTDSGEYLCDVQDDSVVFRVCVEEPPVKIKRLADGPAEHKYLTSEDIALECELSRSDTAAKWYKDGEKLEGNERVSIGKEGTLRSLRILDARTTDSGEYLCDVQDDSVVFRVCVEDSPVTIVGSSQISEDRIFTECETIAMTCQLSRSDVQVRWYRDGTELLPNDKIRIESRGLTRELMIFDSEPGDSGQYVCDAGDDKLTFKVTVTEALVLFTNKEKLPEEVHANENGKAVLAAIVSKENTSVAWYRHKEELPEGGKYERKGESRVHSLIIENVQREDCGFYTCRSADDEMVFNVNMAELPLQFVLKLEDLSVQKGGAVTLWCELNKVKGDVMWLKDGKEVQPSGQRVVRAEGRLRSLTLTKATLEDQGEYSCECKDDKTAAQVSVRVPRVVEFISDLHSVTVLEGDDAKFKCMVSPEDVRMTWRANGAEIPPGSDKYVPSRNGLCHTLLIRSCQLTEAGRVTAEAEGVVSGANLQVQETQIVFTRKMASVVAEELQDTTFEVEVSSESAEVQWMKQGVVIQPSPKFLLQQDGRTRRLIVCSTTFADRGNYRCETLHDRTQAKLTVEARRITVKKRLEDLEVYEKEAVTFQVELSHPDVEGVWIKDGIRVKPNNNRRISSAGKVHSLTLSALTLEDSGTITFQANGARSSSRVTVREPPVTFVKQLKDLRVPETTVITLECELSRPNAEVTWYKDDLEMKPSKNVRIYSMGRKRFAHLGKCGVQDSGKYTCDSGESNTSGMLEIYEREIQIVKELEDAEVRENDNAVFVCEVSHEGVNSEWLKDGYKIRSNNSVKIRQEGAKHFLLICKVRAEDAGEIRFTAKNVESVARLDVNELPIKIVKPLRDKTALEKHKVILECKVSKPRARVRWYRGEEEIHPTDKYEICSEDCYRQLVIHDVSFEDEDSYTCDAFDDCSSAKVLVEEQAILVVKDLADVEVTAPHGVVLECEMSVPVIRPPQWSLNGQLLHHGNGVHVENKGTIQKLILSKTSPGMSGVVKFTAGKARSSAQLTVKAD
ncbi:obscurin-like protein 1a isoform X2 [Scyliorhinus canicula]|uniref:obscurin-like protein 1a isoform X2 n=1 Tax=Scyliorhinus canicula TaxID=7830 RepID=UPI0018F2A81C|nr:obscurin-like protein 1a isoform X2 [Scyliorhinus canicula]